MKNNKEVTAKKTPRFGVLDAVLILLVIVAVVGIYFRYNILDFISSVRNIESYTVSYSIQDIRYTTPSFINIGDDVYFADSGERLGTLTNVSENAGALSVTPSSKSFVNSSGEKIEVMYPDSQSRVDAKGRFECKGNYSQDGGFLVNGKTFIAPGQYLNVHTEYVSVTLRIDEINVLSDQ